jgi:hypothetical protein
MTARVVDRRFEDVNAVHVEKESVLSGPSSRSQSERLDAESEPLAKPFTEMVPVSLFLNRKSDGYLKISQSRVLHLFRCDVYSAYYK